MRAIGQQIFLRSVQYPFRAADGQFEDPEPPLDLALHQFFTPLWAAEALVEKHFKHLTSSDVAMDPSCGEGRMLAAIPAHVPAFGVDIDPIQAARATEITGRRVICGDFQTVPVDLQPTAVIGNPPFMSKVFDRFMDRCHDMLPDGAPAGFILPAYMMQTPERIERLAQRWSITQELLPRTLFPRLSKPLIFCLFRKDKRGILVGFTLFREARAIDDLKPEYVECLRKVSRSAWGTAVAKALIRLGGEASRDDIYAAMERSRPTPNQWWRDKVRQELCQRFRRTGKNRFAIPATAL